jgi:hypothetical protein
MVTGRIAVDGGSQADHAAVQLHAFLVIANPSPVPLIVPNILTRWKTSKMCSDLFRDADP